MDQFLDLCRKQWLEQQMNLWWENRESCVYDSSYAHSYERQFEIEKRRWEEEVLPVLVAAYTEWSDALFEQPQN
jgi:hypothetical protein